MWDPMDRSPAEDLSPATTERFVRPERRTRRKRQKNGSEDVSRSTIAGSRTRKCSTADVAASTVPMTENPPCSGRAGVVLYVTGNQPGCKTRIRAAGRCLVSMPVLVPRPSASVSDQPEATRGGGEERVVLQ